MKKDDADLVLKALAAGPRRKILDLVHRAPGCTIGSVCGAFRMTRAGVASHLAVLERAGLVRSRKVGRERKLTVDLAPLELFLGGRWLATLRAPAKSVGLAARGARGRKQGR